MEYGNQGQIESGVSVGNQEGHGDRIEDIEQERKITLVADKELFIGIQLRRFHPFEDTV